MTTPYDQEKELNWLHEWKWNKIHVQELNLIDSVHVQELNLIDSVHVQELNLIDFLIELTWVGVKLRDEVK